MLELYYLKEADSVCLNRAVITLEEKGITDWKPHYIELLNEDHFESKYLGINPKAVVPTLVHNGIPVRESSIICDYIDELNDLKEGGFIRWIQLNIFS